MTEPVYDKRDQYEKVQEVLLPGEQVEAVFDLIGTGTGFVGITSHRLIVYDKAFLRKMKAIVSVPYNRVLSLAAEDQSGLMTGRGFFGSSHLVITTSHSEYDFEFRGSDKAHLAHNLILRHIL